METFSATDFIAFIKLFTTEFPERYGNGPNGMRASNWLAKRWAGFAKGISWAKVKEDKISGAKQNNVVLTLTGHTDKHIVLGAHMDSTKPDSHKVKPAAWDNAAGSSIIDALAQATLAMKIQPENNVHLVLYGGEEMGMLGSKQMANEFKAAGKQVLAVLNYDMAGSALTQKHQISWATHQMKETLALTNWLKKLLSLYFPNYTTSNKPTTAPSLSDHLSWEVEDFPTAVPGESNPDFSVYHKHTDTWDRLDGAGIIPKAQVGVDIFGR